MATTAAFAVVVAMTGCASPEPTQRSNAAVQTAQNLERRAAQAFAATDFDSAAASYEAAALVYASLALPEPGARARLSAARALADAGRAEQALRSVDALIASPQGISPAVLTVAHGRAAALRIETDAPRAAAHVQSAVGLCAESCKERSALWVLQSRLALAAGNAELAQAQASSALAAATADGDRANALRWRGQARLQAGQAALAVADAQAALALDQALGQAQRVVLDLQLLSAAHAASGNAAEAERTARLAQRASDAIQRLRLGAP